MLGQLEYKNLHKCDNGMEKYILVITIWHHKAYQVITISDLAVWVLSIPSSHK